MVYTGGRTEKQCLKKGWLLSFRLDEPTDMNTSTLSCRSSKEKEACLWPERRHGSVLQETETQHVTEGINSENRGRCQAGRQKMHGWLPGGGDTYSEDKRSWNEGSRQDPRTPWSPRGCSLTAGGASFTAIGASVCHCKLVSGKPGC